MRTKGRMYPDHVYENVVTEEELMVKPILGRFRVTYQVMRMVSLWASTEDEAISLVNSNWRWMDDTTDDIGYPDILDITEISNSD